MPNYQYIVLNVPDKPKQLKELLKRAVKAEFPRYDYLYDGNDLWTTELISSDDWHAIHWFCIGFIAGMKKEK